VSKDQNVDLLDQAGTFHSAGFDDFRTNTFVPYYTLFVNERVTPAGVREYPCWPSRTCWDWYTFLLGDDTVPAVSARLWGKAGDWSGQAKGCVFRMGYITNGHGTLMSDTHVITDVLHLLHGEDTQYCTLTPASEQQLITQINDPYLMLSVWGDTRLSVTDSMGNFSGITPDGWIVNKIPGASFDTGEAAPFWWCR